MSSHPGAPWQDDGPDRPEDSSEPAHAFEPARGTEPLLPTPADTSSDRMATLGASTEHIEESSLPWLSHYEETLLAPPRFPNFADFGVFLILLAFAWLASGALVIGAVHAHLFGITTLPQAAKDVRYNLGGQAFLYIFALVACSLVFRSIWNLPFFTGIEWRAGAAIRARWRLAAALGVCLVLAIADSVFLPGPEHAPIEDVFRQPGAAWLLFAFGVTLAPLMEELAFRGFLLPALCTGWDWMMERLQHRPAPFPDEEGKTRWSLSAMAVGSILTSIPFALIHAPQTGYSFGPFALLVCVGMAFCWVRLSTRSLAASTAVHACYNLTLFTLMLAGTGGFKHLDKI